MIAGDREIEKWLLSTAGEHVAADVRSHVEESLSEPASQAALTGSALASGCPVCHAVDAPVYNPGIWNTPSVQPHNNCYNYANNRITNTFAQPGRATGHQYTQLKTCTGAGAVEPAAQSDGLVPSAGFTAPLSARHGWYVALVLWPNADYHWYRQDKVGCWSHKPGSTAARNVDNANHPIKDPKIANRGPYTVFCAYMITKSSVHIR